MGETVNQARGFPVTNLYLLTAVVVTASLAAHADTKGLNALKSLSVQRGAGGAQVLVEASTAPVYTVFRLNDPDRLVVDVANANTAAIKGHHDGVGPVSGVVASQFSGPSAEVGRILVGLEGASKYDVRAEKSTLVISIEGEGRKAEPRAAAEPAPAAAAVAQAEAAREAPAASAPEKVAHPDGIVASHLDEKPVTRPATRLKSIGYSNHTLRLTTDAEVAKFELIQLENPNRLAVDVYGVKSSAKAPRVSDALVREVRVGPSAEKVRVVIEASGEMPEYKAARRPDGLSVALSPPATIRDATPGEAAVLEIDGKPIAVETKAQPIVEGNAVVKGVEFAEAQNGGRVEVKLQGHTRWKVERPDGKSAVLTLESATIAKAQERTLDTGELSTPVKMVSAFGVPGKNAVRVVVSSAAGLSEKVRETPQGLTWQLGSKDEGAETAVSESQTAGFATESSDFASSSAPQRPRYVGKKVSFEFKDIDIHNLLRIIAEISKKNLVVADDVAGRITIRLRNVPWDQALDLILRTKGLGMEDLGNIIRVAPLATLEAEAKARLERTTAARKSAELTLQLVPVNYASATEMATRVKEVLSERGSVSIDTRTNTLIVRDLPQNMGKVRGMVASLDTQTPQVLIEGRIVEANVRYAREIGVQWGGQAMASQTTGNPTGLVFPSSMALTGGVAGNTAGVSSTPNYAVSLPVGAGDGSGGAIGMIFGSAGGASQLNLRLSALEAQGMVKTVSSPKVTTMDNESAKISQGVSIPFSQASAGGTNTSFIEARLSLDVTPHITQDGSVLMQVTAQNNQPDPANTGANGQPAIQRKEANTKVLVKDGDTTVIGGIYIRIGSNNSSGLPVLSKIPVIGFFFRNYRELESKSEMLIFITPRILNRQAVAQTL